MKGILNSSKVASSIALIALVVSIGTYVDVKQRNMFDITAYNEERLEDVLSTLWFLKIEMEKGLNVALDLKGNADYKTSVEEASNIFKIIEEMANTIKRIEQIQETLQIIDTTNMKDPTFWYSIRREVQNLELEYSTVRVKLEESLYFIKTRNKEKDIIK